MDFVDLFEWVQALGPEDLPPVPFSLNSVITVTDAAKFLESLKRDVLPDSPRRRTGVVHEDLRRLYEICATWNSDPTRKKPETRS